MVESPAVALAKAMASRTLMFSAENMRVREAMAFASATAGLSTTKIGTAKAMPNREQIEECLGGK